jgi:hypothetical protein
MSGNANIDRPRTNTQDARSRLPKQLETCLNPHLETSDMNRVHAYWFHFFGFPLPLAEGSI